jgi:hypothetical protein
MWNALAGPATRLSPQREEGFRNPWEPRACRGIVAKTPEQEVQMRFLKRGVVATPNPHAMVRRNPNARSRREVG